MSVDRKQLTIQLRNLSEWRDAYYNGNALVSDAIYDDVEDQARDAASQLPDDDKLKIQVDEFLARVGAPIPDPVATGGKQHWKKAKHTAPAGSLNKAVPDADPKAADVDADVRAWLKDCMSKLGISTMSGVYSDKCDGISILLYYVAGKLEQAITRGDGAVGEDITRNVVKMQGVKPFIKGLTGDIRGEIVLTKTDWKKYFPGYANPRNAASGIAKRLDGTGSEHLTVLHYRLHRTVGKPMPSKAAEFKVLAHLGCALPSWGEFNGIDELIAVQKRYVDGDRAALDYDIDGMVYEFSDPAHMDALGEKNNRPRGAVAYKFPHEEKPSTLEDVRWQVGNSGRITPVAIFAPVQLTGATVTKASLHNLSNIDRLLASLSVTSLHVGDEIVVSRRNDVIPYVEKVLASGDITQPLDQPTKCPVCDTDVIRDGEYLMCPADDTCPAQIAGAVKRWVTKIGCKGVGGTLIEALCDQGIIADAADLYGLDKGELSEVRIDGRRVGGTADTVVDELNSRKELPLHVFVGSLNIHLCSRSTCRTIMDSGFDSLDKMQAATFSEVASISGMGKGRGKAFTDGILAKKDLIDRLLAAGVTIKAAATGAMKGKSVCMTGFRDPDMAEAIEAQGGVVKSSVTKTLTILVAKDPKSNSGKAKKARGQGTEIIDPDEMRTRLGL
jgi:DNA ligase (NAD+)